MRRAILNEQWLNGYVVNSNLPIGTPMAWLSEVPPVGFLAFDGSEYNQEDFPELYEVVKNISSFHSDTEGKFKIPNLKGRVLQGADTVIGELIEAGLPNIIGEVKNNDNYGSIQMVNPKFEGAFSGQYHGNAGWSGSVWGCHTLKIDASKGETKTDGTLKTANEHHVYGASDTVQPPAFTVRWIIKATNYVSLEKNAIDDTKTTNANAWSAEKINKMMGYTTEETIIGKWIDGKPIYRKVFTGDFGTIGTTFINLTSKISTVNKTNIDMILNVWAKGIYQGNIYQYTSGFMYESRPDNNYYIQMLGADIVNVNTIILEYTKTTD